MKKYTYIVLVAILMIGIVPVSAHAAAIYLETAKNTLSVGDTAVISVKINAQGTTINTVEGNIVFKSPAINLAVQEFSLANSAFGLWPRTPSLSADAKIVSFVGGVPGGFNIEGATIFKIIVEAKKEGTITITPENFAAYANDGSGTKLPVQVSNLVITVGPQKTGTAVTDEWQAVVSSDATPPEDFIIVLGQDQTLFEGKKFAFFSALDNQSGIDHYEVSENGAPVVRSGSTYVLIDQTDAVKLSVTAYDKAGNKKVSSYPTESATRISWLRILIIVVVVVIIRFIVKRMRRSKQNVPTPIQ